MLEPFIDEIEDDMDDYDEDPGYTPTDSGDIEIERDEDGFLVGFKGDPDLVPEHVRSNPGALVQGLHGFVFETPVWGHADTFMELEEAGLLQLVDEPKQVTFGPYEVFIYEVPFDL
jgi:hypothetical protein